MFGRQYRRTYHVHDLAFLHHRSYRLANVASYRPHDSQDLFSLDKIDLEGQAAELIAGADAKPLTVRIIRAINANHFLEVVNEGFLNLTTIYDKDAKTGTYPAVHSRHLGILGQPVFGQYTGTCKDK